jgi:predicted permease
MQLWLRDFRYALRMLGKNPGLTAVIVLSLAVGIGANSAIYSVVDALLLRPLPYPQPERLANIWLHSPGIGIFRDWPSPGQYIDIQNENHSFAEMAIARLGQMTLTGREQPERVDGMRASSTLLHMLGARPLLGRSLLPEEDKPGKPAVAVLSYRTWARLFNSDAAIVGKGITLNGTQYTVAGVLRPEFRLNSEVMPSEGPMDKADVFLPLPLGADAVNRRGDENYNVMVRLRPGVSVAKAQADIDIIADRVRQKDKRDRTFGMTVVGLQEQVVGDVRRALLVLLGSVALVLLIACANVANLLLTRAVARQKEVAIRTALGAGWQRLVRQLLTESLLLAVMGGAAGLVIAGVTLYAVPTLNPGNIPRLEDIGISGAVLAFTFGVSLATGVLFGIAPAWRAMKVDLITSLKSGGRSGQTDGGLRLARNRLRSLLVVCELALSLMLLIGAGLLIRSFARLQDVPPGFNPEHVLSMRVTPVGPKYREDKAVVQFFQAIGDRVSHLPGVKTEGLVSALPLTGEVGWGQISVEGYTPPPGQELQVDLRVASTDYFRALEIPLRKGRFFDEHDDSAGQQVAVIDEKFARRFWPHDNPIGKHLWFDPKKPMTIVGVVGVVKHYGLASEGKIVVYFPHQQQPDNGMYLVVRTSSDAAALSGAVVREIHAVDPSVAVYEIRTMQDRLYGSLARQRFSATMLSAFAAFALLLAAVGTYGVLLAAQQAVGIGVARGRSRLSGAAANSVVRSGGPGQSPPTAIPWWCLAGRDSATDRRDGRTPSARRPAGATA